MAKWDNTGRALSTTSGIVWVWGKNTCWHLMRPPRNADVYSLRTICLFALLCGFILHNASVLPSFSADILSPGYIQTAVSTLTNVCNILMFDKGLTLLFWKSVISFPSHLPHTWILMFSLRHHNRPQAQMFYETKYSSWIIGQIFKNKPLECICLNECSLSLGEAEPSLKLSELLSVVWEKYLQRRTFSIFWEYTKNKTQGGLVNNTRN